MLGALACVLRNQPFSELGKLLFRSEPKAGLWEGFWVSTRYVRYLKGGAAQYGKAGLLLAIWVWSSRIMKRTRTVGLRTHADARVRVGTSSSSFYIIVMVARYALMF